MLCGFKAPSWGGSIVFWGALLAETGPLLLITVEEGLEEVSTAKLGPETISLLLATLPEKPRRRV